MRSDTGWFRDAKWGVFLHYLAGIASGFEKSLPTSAEWNRRVNSFDVESCAEQLSEAGAGYAVITIGQNSGHYCSPNAIYDRFIGRKPSLCSERDLVADLASALERRGIPLMAYAPCHAPSNDIPSVIALGCTPPWEDGGRGWGLPDGLPIVEGTDARMSRFQARWESVLKEWSLRWGKLVRGWWIDGCYYSDQLYRHPDPPNFQSFTAALKAGNPNSIVAYNSGIRIPVISLTEHEDYTAGELNGSFPTDIIRPPKFRPIQRWVDGAQYHILTFMAGWWGWGEPRFTPEFIIGATKEINSHEGVISWDVPVSPEGRIADPFMIRLRALKAATRR